MVSHVRHTKLVDIDNFGFNLSVLQSPINKMGLILLLHLTGVREDKFTDVCEALR